MTDTSFTASKAVYATIHERTSTDRRPGLSFCRKIQGIATIRGSKDRTPSAMPGAMPKKANQAAATELHSIKCSFTEASQSVLADATEAKNIAAAMKIQYRLSNFTLLNLCRIYI